MNGSQPDEARVPALKWCFCTLALGENYTRLAAQLAADMERWAPGIRFLVFTNSPGCLKDCSNVDVVFHTQRSMHGFNDKLCVMKQSLDRFESAIFIDADSRILSPVKPAADIFEPGIRAILLRTWGYIYDTSDHSPDAPNWKKEDLRMMRLLQGEVNPAVENRDVPYVLESLFAVTRSETVDANPFLREWERLANLCERNRFFKHEGFSMGLAAQRAGFSIQQVEFAGLQVFEPLIARRISIPAGKMTEEEFEALNASVVRYKTKRAEPGRAQRVLQSLQRRLRYWRIRMFGLKLI